MPYADPEAQREYQRTWLLRRRSAWLEIHGPCGRCGSDVDLEVDHIERSTKVDHKVWSWSKARREAELAKCQVLCGVCHKAKTKVEVEGYQHGTNSCYTGPLRCRCLECIAAHAAEARNYRGRSHPATMPA